MTKTKNARFGATNTAAGKPMKYTLQHITTAVVLFIIPSIDAYVTTGMTAHGRPQGNGHAHP